MKPGVWAVAGTPVTDPYPCRCRERYDRCSPIFCPCAGRVDLEVLPTGCCATWHTPDVVAAAQRARAQ